MIIKRTIKSSKEVIKHKKDNMKRGIIEITLFLDMDGVPFIEIFALKQIKKGIFKKKWRPYKCSDGVFENLRIPDEDILIDAFCKKKTEEVAKKIISYFSSDPSFDLLNQLEIDGDTEKIYNKFINKMLNQIEDKKK